MMMVSKRSFFPTLAVLTLSLSAGAMQEEKYDKVGKSDCHKTVLEVGHECGDNCDECTDQMSDQRSQFDISQSSQTSQFDLCQSEQIDHVGHSQKDSCTSSSSQVQCGCLLQANDCAHHYGNKDKHYLQDHWQHQNSASFTKIRAHGHRGSRLQWGKANWDGLYSQDMELERVALNGSHIQKANLFVKFTKVHLNNATIQNTTFQGSFDEAEFRKSKLENVMFSNAQFDAGHHGNSCFDDAELDNVQFGNSHMKRATFRGALLRNVSLSCSNTEAFARFTQANVWNGKSWKRLSKKPLQALSAHVRACKEGSVNLTTWAQTYQGW